MNDIEAGAVFSQCRRWRYVLWRVWDSSKPFANFLMLNPSKAAEVVSDPTVTRAKIYAHDWGYGGLKVTNIFAWVDTDPAGMYAAEDPIGPDNNQHIVDTAMAAGVVVCAWGNHGSYRARGHEVTELLRANRIRTHALKINKATGSPSHPLYLKSDLRPTPWPAYSIEVPHA